MERGRLPIDGPHRMYWEQCGTPAGAPVVFLHGGPGAGASPVHPRLFDPAHYPAVIFDQRGVFLCRKREIDWFLYGMRGFAPEAWRTFAEFLPAAERGDLLAGYHRRLVDPDPAVHMPAARAWSVYEGTCCTLLPSPETVQSVAEDRMALGLARMEAHYFKN